MANTELQSGGLKQINVQQEESAPLSSVCWLPYVASLGSFDHHSEPETHQRHRSYTRRRRRWRGGGWNCSVILTGEISSTCNLSTCSSSCSMLSNFKGRKSSAASPPPSSASALPISTSTGTTASEPWRSKVKKIRNQSSESQEEKKRGEKREEMCHEGLNRWGEVYLGAGSLVERSHCEAGKWKQLIWMWAGSCRPHLGRTGWSWSPSDCTGSHLSHWHTGIEPGETSSSGSEA